MNRENLKLRLYILMLDQQTERKYNEADRTQMVIDNLHSDSPNWEKARRYLKRK